MLPDYWQKDLDELKALRATINENDLVKLVDDAIDDLSRRWRVWIAPETIRTVQESQRFRNMLKITQLIDD